MNKSIVYSIYFVCILMKMIRALRISLKKKELDTLNVWLEKQKL